MRLAFHAMATRFEVVLEGGTERSARAAGEAALEEIAECHKRLSRFDRASFVSHVNRTAHRVPVALDEDLWELFHTAESVRLQSGGAFDVTAGSPGTLALHEATRTLRLSEPGTRVDLGGIAKGFALDMAGRALRDAGVERALLHGGTSSVLALGGPWRIGLAHGGEVEIEGRALGVSAQRRADDDHSARGHVYDARSPAAALPERVAAVTAPNATLADAWSTALVVLAPDDVPAEALARSGVERTTS